MRRAAAAAASLAILSGILLSAFVPGARCQDDTGDYGDDSPNPNAGVNQFFTGVLYSRLSNLTDTFAVEISSRLGFCIKDSYVMASIGFSWF